MRLGGPVFGKFDDPAAWTEAVRRLGYRAAYCPLDAKADAETVRAYLDAAADADITIAEVGAWSNPMSRDEETRRAALALCRERLALAEAMGARCCVNIAGSCGKQWDGHDPRNLTRETFDAIVETVRSIIDAVKPARTYYALETMPWMYPDSTDSYERLLQAVDRKQFAVHFDPVNLVSSPQRYYQNALLIREFLDRLGGQIRSVHAKDIALSGKLTVHLDEVRPGQGGLDYRTFLRDLDRLDPDIPVMLEHLPSPGEYAAAADHIRGVASDIGVSL